MSHNKKDNKSSNLNDMLVKHSGYNAANNQHQAGEDEHGVQLPPGLSNASKQILNRVKAIKKVQLESLGVESKFYERVHQLEVEFQPLFDQLAEKRKAIVTGMYEPLDNECDIPLIAEVDPEELKAIEENAPVEQGNYSKGIHGFWYEVLNMTQIADSIEEHDVPILKDYLEDVTTEVYSSPPGFALLFHFAENPFFSNQMLKKYYELQMELPSAGGEDGNPFHYDGPTIRACQGTVIDWLPGKNVTVKLIKKPVKKGPQAGKTQTKTVSCESFFNFFTPKYTEEAPDMDPEAEEELHHDFEMGQVMRDEIVPRAVLYFTGEAVEEEDPFDDYDEEEEGDDQTSDMDE